MINFWNYRNLFERDVGEYLARLDYKEIKDDELIAYFTTENGCKVSELLYLDCDWYEIENIPVGAIVILSVNYKLGDEFAFIQDVEWLKDKYDLDTAVKEYYL